MTCADIITITNYLDYGIYETEINNDNKRGKAARNKWYCRAECPIFYVEQRYAATGTHDESGYTYKFLTPELNRCCKTVVFYRYVEIFHFKLTSSSINYYKFNPQNQDSWDTGSNYHKLADM
jgi:hypothetical protein